jgi:predicted TPR repeat methyltransferase
MPPLDKTSREILQRAYDLKSKEETKALYRDWAKTYDQTMVAGLHYSAPTKVVDMLEDWLPEKSALVVDIGCGTGLTGQAAAEKGFDQLVGLDFSDEMLAQAEKRGIYQNLINADLTDRLDIETGRFDAGVSSGIFTYGHLDASCLDEIFRIIRMDGLFACVVRLQVWEGLDFAKRFAELENLKLVEKLDEQLTGNYETSEQADGRYLVFRKTGQW